MRAILAALVLLLAAPAWGAAGDPCTAGATWIGGKCTILCDALTADATCGPIRLENPINSLAIELQSNTDCSAGDANVFSKSDATSATAAVAPWHHIGRIDFESGATETALNSMILIDGQAAAPMRWIKAEVTSAEGCSNATIVIHQRN